ncbi:hypothetical protein PHET_06366 [Paragonimus heterotremus]|uniref:Uncharacterized protein n=1 Tax=Paragonimus heterotremus TaxID=100268 RepID=A0A8J4TDY8_9TREM|nr:hypothetical protein PHET_06366 [Paragonimus heterotremus]
MAHKRQSDESVEGTITAYISTDLHISMASGITVLTIDESTCLNIVNSQSSCLTLLPLELVDKCIGSRIHIIMKNDKEMTSLNSSSHHKERE